jgi:hypothetical protein
MRAAQESLMTIYDDPPLLGMRLAHSMHLMGWTA